MFFLSKDCCLIESVSLNGIYSIAFKVDIHSMKKMHLLSRHDVTSFHEYPIYQCQALMVLEI